jgi:hypothetical protein
MASVRTSMASTFDWMLALVEKVGIAGFVSHVVRGLPSLHPRWPGKGLLLIWSVLSRTWLAASAEVDRELDQGCS